MFAPPLVYKSCASCPAQNAHLLRQWVIFLHDVPNIFALSASRLVVRNDPKKTLWKWGQSLTGKRFSKPKLQCPWWRTKTQHLDRHCCGSIFLDNPRFDKPVWIVWSDNKQNISLKLIIKTQNFSELWRNRSRLIIQPTYLHVHTYICIYVYDVRVAVIC